MASLTLLLALVIRLGQVLWLSGSVRSKNAAGAGVRLVVDLAVVVLSVWAIGAGFANSNYYFDSESIFGLKPQRSLEVLEGYLPAILIATGAIHAAMEERARVLPLLILSAVMAAIGVPVATMLCGKSIGYIDMPISIIGIGTLVGGAGALVGSMLLGPRKGKLNRDRSVNFIPGHNLTMAIAGVLVLTIGWIGCRIAGDSQANLVLPSTLLCMSAATVTCSIYSSVRFGKIDVGLLVAAVLGGIAAGACSGTGVPTYVGAILGVIVGVVAPFALMEIEFRGRIDDVGSSITIHLVCGLLGALITPMFRAGELVKDRVHSLGDAALAAVIALGVGAVCAFVVCIAFKSIKKLRQSETAEYDGSDLAEFDINAYPDFQQTMIKSYHLRQL